MISGTKILFRGVNRHDSKEIRFIAEMDARIPLEFDPTYIFVESSIDSRIKYYNELSPEDFFEVAIEDNSVVAFHIVKKLPYPPDLFIGIIVSLWVHPNFRNKGLAAELKVKAEQWAKNGGMVFLQTNVHKNNSRMLDINQACGYETSYINLRKKII